MTRRWLWYVIDTLIGAAILVGACALIYAAPFFETVQSCNKDERVTCLSGPCSDSPCWRDQTKEDAWGIRKDVCGDGTYYSFVDKASQRWVTIPVPPCSVECDP